MQLAVAKAKYFQSDHIHEIVSTAHTPNYSKVNSCEILGKVISNSKVTRDISEILYPLENSETAQFILIEGAPGIGNSFLLKEIAFRWGKGLLLQNLK